MWLLWDHTGPGMARGRAWDGAGGRVHVAELSATVPTVRPRLRCAETATGTDEIRRRADNLIYEVRACLHWHDGEASTAW